MGVMGCVYIYIYIYICMYIYRGGNIATLPGWRLLSLPPHMCGSRWNSGLEFSCRMYRAHFGVYGT